MPLGITPPWLDPFSEVQDRIAEILSNDIDLSVAVPEGNRVEDGDEKTITAPADYGEWRVIPFFGGGANLRATSSSTHVVQNFEIGIATDREDVKDIAFPIKWMVLRALTRALDNDLGGRSVLGLPYVIDLSILDMREMADNPVYNRGVPGWASITIVSVKMSFNTQDLIAR